MTPSRLERLHQARLYGILDTQYAEPSTWPELCLKWIRGGVQIVQVRAKNLPTEEVEKISRDIAPILHDHSTLFIINDHPQLVPILQADGCHVGQEDISVDQARALAGENMLVGKSTHSVEQAVNAQMENPDYIGVGPLFATATKPDYTPVGLALIRAVSEKVALPKFCIGGIKLHNLPEVIAAGARRVVIVSGLIQTDDAEDYARQCRQLLDAKALSDHL